MNNLLSSGSCRLRTKWGYPSSALWFGKGLIQVVLLVAIDALSCVHISMGGMSEKKGSQRRFIILAVLAVILIVNGMKLYLNNSTS